MTNKAIIHSDQAPAAIGTYSQAVKVNNTVYLSGQIPLDPVSGEIPESIEAQTLRSLQNVQAIIEAAGGQVRQPAGVQPRPAFQDPPPVPRHRAGPVGRTQQSAGDRRDGIGVSVVGHRGGDDRRPGTLQRGDDPAIVGGEVGGVLSRGVINA